jgi:hypothetical protein
MKIPFTGGCMCGAIRYECSTEPLAMGICHCRDCQRATGSAFAAALMLPRNAVTIIRIVRSSLLLASLSPVALKTIDLTR